MEIHHVLKVHQLQMDKWVIFKSYVTLLEGTNPARTALAVEARCVIAAVQSHDPVHSWENSMPRDVSSSGAEAAHEFCWRICGIFPYSPKAFPMRFADTSAQWIRHGFLRTKPSWGVHADFPNASCLVLGSAASKSYVLTQRRNEPWVSLKQIGPFPVIPCFMIMSCYFHVISHDKIMGKLTLPPGKMCPLPRTCSPSRTWITMDCLGVVRKHRDYPPVKSHNYGKSAVLLMDDSVQFIVLGCVMIF